MVRTLLHGNIRNRNIRNSIFLVLLFCISVLSAISARVLAHNTDGDVHPVTADKSDAGSVQQFGVETLRIPDVPVIDTHYRTTGFVSRFADAGTVVISLTYTGCETLCPISNVILQQLDRALADSNVPHIQIVTLSIDPDKDTPETLQASAERLESSERWTWLTATAEHSRMLFSSLDVDVNELEEHDPMFLVGNVSTGRFIRVVGMPDPDQLFAISRSEQL